MSDVARYTAFAGEQRLAAGAPWDVALAVRDASSRGDAVAVLTFDDRTGRQIDLDLRGNDDDIVKRLKTPAAEQRGDAARTPGRPKLGVVSREVTLLPRHWEWLGQQSGGASAALRRLVDAARKQEGLGAGAGDARQAADRFMMTMLGNEPGYEEASRALYAGDRGRFFALSDDWPVDLRDYARMLAEAGLDEVAG
jgi:hypothetical protein